MKKVINVLSIVGTCVASVAGCGESTVSFSNDVRPILAQHCLECHQPGGNGFEETGLAVGTYEGLMKGTKYGPVVKSGDSLTSALMMLVEGRADPSIRMPHGKKPLTEENVAILKKWIEQGAKNN